MSSHNIMWVKASFPDDSRTCFFTSINLKDDYWGEKSNDANNVSENGDCDENKSYYEKYEDAYYDEDGERHEAEYYSDGTEEEYSDDGEHFDDKIEKNDDEEMDMLGNKSPVDESDYDSGCNGVFEGEFADDEKLMAAMGLPLRFGGRGENLGMQRRSERHKRHTNHALKSDWNSYWELHGQTILMNSWVAKYKDYINPEFLNRLSPSISESSITGDTIIDFSRMKIEESTAVSTDSKDSNSSPKLSSFTSSDYFADDDMKIENNIVVEKDEEGLLHVQKNYNNMFSVTNAINGQTNCEMGEEQWKKLWKGHVASQTKLIRSQFKQFYHDFPSSTEEDRVNIDEEPDESVEKYLKNTGFIVQGARSLKASLQYKHNRRYEHYWTRAPGDFYKQFNDILGPDLITEQYFDMDKDLFGEIENIGLSTDAEEVGSDHGDLEMETILTKDDSTTTSSEVNKMDESNVTPVEDSNEQTEKPFGDSLEKYWQQRYRLFHRYDEGIKLDNESWFSVTPEKIAEHIAERCRCNVIIDAFCGAGGNSIQFAYTCNLVIAIDIDPKKLELAKHNAEVYGVTDNIEFICGDFLELAPSLNADVVFLSPPWGGPEYIEKDSYSIEEIQPNIFEVFKLSKNITPHVALYVPKNTVINQLMTLGRENETVEVEQNRLYSKVKAITAYYGELALEPEML